MDTIQIREKVFLINTDHTSYMFRVDQYGHLEHIHYGTKVPLSDWKALSYKKLILHGDTILYGHDHIQEDDIRMLRLIGIHSRLSVRHLNDILDRAFSQVCGKILPCQYRIITNKDF